MDFDADQIIFDHVWKTLPDSISERRRILLALQCKLTKRHPAWANIAAQLVLLASLDQAQREFSFAQPTNGGKS